MAIRTRLALVAFLGLIGITPTVAATWGVITHDGGGREIGPYLTSLAGGEAAIGAIRSPEFTLDADMVTFEMNGHDGPPATRRLKSWFALCDAKTGLALRRTNPPAQDMLTPVSWDVLELIGRRVYFRAVDGVAENAFAWMGMRNLRVGDREILGPLTVGKFPAGWNQETQPQGTSVDKWLEVKSAVQGLAIEEETSTATWAVYTINGERKTCPPYLSSLWGGESGVGAVRSPVFTLDTPTYRFMASGTDTPTGDGGMNLFQLVDANTLEVLRTHEPPTNNLLVPMSWDTKDLVGRKVFFRAVDGNSGTGWAWMGFDKVPLGAGKVADFTKPDAIVGWREEGQPEGARIGGGSSFTTLREMVEAEWRLEDQRLGVRWALWESNAPAAPYLMRRLARVMDGDFERGEKLVKEFSYPPGPPPSEGGGGTATARLAGIRTRLSSLHARFADLQKSPTNVKAWQDLRREQRVALRELAFANPALSANRFLFVKRFTQQSYCDINVNHHAWGSRPGGGVCLLQLAGATGTPTVTDLFKGRLGVGNVHGFDVDWDAKRILFSWAKAASPQPPEGWLSRQATFDLHRTVGLLHLYEMNADGSNLRQLTSGEWSDLNPCYLPGGDIAFESERCALEIECNECDKDEPTTNLYAMRGDGTGVRRLTLTKDGDWYPRVANDGTIVYSHWEYQERSLMFIHPLWMVRPDGTGADNFAKQHFDYPVTLTAPRPLATGDKLIAIAGGHHTLAAGPVVFVDRSVGPNDPACLTRITGPDCWPELGGAAPGPNVPGWRTPPGQGWYMDPYPLSDTTYLASYCDGQMQDEKGYGLYLMDVYGGKELLYRDPAISSVMPYPLAPRKEPPVVPSSLMAAAKDATCVLTNVAEGVPELAPGAVKSLRITEPVPWTYSNVTGGVRYEPDAKATGVSWTPVRILGTVPVEADGSAHFRVPADTGLYFQALDQNGMELRRMRSYISFRAGEMRSCNGCHETRALPPGGKPTRPLAAMRAASLPSPPPWGADKPLSFLRDVQPILNRNCVSCHTGLRPAGNVDLSPGLTVDHNRAYDTLTDPNRGLVTVASKGDDAVITGVLAFGAHKSRLVSVIRDKHRDRCQLTLDEWSRLYTWLDANCIYHDGFIIKRPESALPYLFAEDHTLWDKIGAIQQRRCASCHSVAELARPDWADLSAPEKSLFLTAPLAGAATPTGKHCTPAVFAGKADPDYAALLALVDDAAKRSWEKPRRDLTCLAAK